MQIRDYIAPLLKWWWLILISTMIAGVSSYFAVRQQPATFQSATTLIIGNAIENPNPSGNDFYLAQQLAGTYVSLANRSSVRQATMEALGLTWLPDIRVSQNSNTIVILVTAYSPELAQAVAAELANQLILRSPTSASENQERQGFINKQLDDYEMAITETRAQIAEKNNQLPELISAREIADLQSEIETLETNLQRLQTSYALLLQNTQKGAANTLSIIEPAYLPQAPVDPRNEFTVIVAMSVGFVLAAAAAFLMEYLDDTIQTPEQLAQLTEEPTVVNIGQMKSSDSGLVTVAEPRSSTSEAFRVLRTGVQFASIDNPLQVVLVTSATPGEGKTTISANLAVVLAQAGHKVLLVDADLRSPSQQDTFKLDNSSGLTTVLLYFEKAHKDGRLQQVLEKAILPTTVQGLEVLSSGPIPPNPSELLGSAKMRELLQYLKQEYDYIVFDSPPVLPVTDAVILSLIVDRTILVVRAGKSRSKYVQHVSQRLHEVNANLLGCVLNGTSARNSYYGDYSEYPYSESHKDDQGEKQNGKVTKINRGLKKKIITQ